MMATIMAGNTYGGLPGWRVAFLVMAGTSSVIGWFVHTLVLDPKKPVTKAFEMSRSRNDRDRRYGEENGDYEAVETSLSRSSSSESVLRLLEEETMAKNLHGAWRDAWVAVRSVLKVRSFQIIVLQGIVGSLPWTAMVFFTMWMELIGFRHKQAASLMGIFSGGCAAGALFGGWIGDRAERRYPGRGRIMCAQFSSFIGAPFSCLLLLVLPQDPQFYGLFATTLLLMGLTVSWCQACANNPIFADVVPEQNRTMIYAFDRALEGSFSAMAAPIVGLLAEGVFGYRAGQVIPDSGSPLEARALSRGLCTVMAIPFGLCCMCYTFLYGTYQRDKEEVRNHSFYPKFDSSVDDLTSVKFVSD